MKQHLPEIILFHSIIRKLKISRQKFSFIYLEKKKRERDLPAEMKDKQTSASVSAMKTITWQ